MRRTLLVAMLITIGWFTLSAVLSRFSIPPHTAPRANTSSTTESIPDGQAHPSASQQDTESGYLYRWQETPGGSVHISSERPPASISSEIIRFDKRTASTKPDTGHGPANTVADDATPTWQKGTAIKPFAVYTPEGFNQLLKDADALHGLFEQRRTQLQELEQQLNSGD